MASCGTTTCLPYKKSSLTWIDLDFYKILGYVSHIGLAFNSRNKRSFYFPSEKLFPIDDFEKLVFLDFIEVSFRAHPFGLVFLEKLQSTQSQLMQRCATEQKKPFQPKYYTDNSKLSNSVQIRKERLSI